MASDRGRTVRGCRDMARDRGRGRAGPCDADPGGSVRPGDL